MTNIILFIVNLVIGCFIYERYEKLWTPNSGNLYFLVETLMALFCFIIFPMCAFIYHI